MTMQDSNYPTTIPTLYDQAHQRLPDHVRVLPVNHPDYQDALRRMVDVVLAEDRDQRDADDRARSAHR